MQLKNCITENVELGNRVATETLVTQLVGGVNYILTKAENNKELLLIGVGIENLVLNRYRFLTCQYESIDKLKDKRHCY